MPTYQTAAALRTELGFDATTLPDAAADKILLTAEDLVDGALGPRPVDITTGRRVVQANVEAWQWAKLQRATLKLAVGLYGNPNLATGTRYRRVSGPDFSFSDPVGGGGSVELGPEIEAILSASGLRLVRGIGSIYTGPTSRLRGEGVVGNL